MCADRRRTHIASVFIADVTACAFHLMLRPCLRVQVARLERLEVTGAELKQAILAVRLETVSQHPIDMFSQSKVVLALSTVVRWP